MKLRVLNYRVAASHSSMSTLNYLNEPVSITDFDAFVCDLEGLSSDNPSPQSFARRQSELKDLLQRKGGIVVCYLRPDGTAASGVGTRYGLLQHAAPGPVSLVANTVRYGEGSRIKIVSNSPGASAGYLQVLRSTMRFVAHLETSQQQISQNAGIVFATDSAGYPVAVEFVVAEGRISFLPLPESAPPERIGAAILRVITSHFSKVTEIDAPTWTTAITVPGADVHDERILGLTKQSEELNLQIAALKHDREEVLKYVRLLYGYGKGVLEPVVRAAFRQIGFTVPEPEDYDGEWDFELHENGPTRTALGEVEGSEGIVDVDKYRQLLDYVDAEAREGRQHKGILVGNGYRLQPLEATERENQFSEHARNGAVRNQFCLLPSTELFKAVSAVLASPEDSSLKRGIRDSLFATTGVWKFEKDKIPEDKLPAVASAS
jgi:hypothetical protein